MDNLKMVYSNFNPETGISTVTLANRTGNYTATTKLHKDDIPYSSHYAGCRFAELKAWNKYYRKQSQILSHKIKVMEEYYDLISHMREFNSKSVEASKARRMIYELKDKKKNYDKLAVAVKISFKSAIKERDEICRKKKEN